MEEKLKCIIVDDELSARRVLSSLCSEFCPKVEVIGEADSAMTAFDLINEKSPDFIFLDIRMPIKDGFQLLEMFKEISFKVVFTTAYDQYAVQAFKFSAIDYLLKPIDIDELITAVDKVCKSKDKEGDIERIEVLKKNMNTASSSKIALPTSDGFVFLDSDAIIRCEAYGNYTKVFQEGDNRPILVTQTLKYFENLLEESSFFRIHKSYIVNLSHVRRFIKGKPAKVVLSDAAEVEVSVRKKELLVQKLMA